MMQYFSDETENGLLLLNYPMVESFRHCKALLPDKEYIDLTVNTNEVKLGKYKSIVDNQGICKNISQYTNQDFELLFLQKLIKVYYITH